MAGPPAAATLWWTIGWADLRRRAASLVVGVALTRLRRPPRFLRGSQLGPARPREVMKGALSVRRVLVAGASCAGESEAFRDGWIRWRQPRAPHQAAAARR